MTDYHLAQINSARLVAPIDSPRVADFANALNKINALAERTPGFVWRLVSEGGENAIDVEVIPDDPLVAVNMSVWENIESLYRYAYSSEHADFFARRREWFTKWEKPSPVLWWIPAGHTPTLAEALARCDYLAAHGPTPHAFNFKTRFTSAEATAYTPQALR